MFPANNEYTWGGEITVWFKGNSFSTDLIVSFDSSEWSFPEVYLPEHQPFIDAVTALIGQETGFFLNNMERAEMGAQGDAYCAFETLIRSGEDVTFGFINHVSRDSTRKVGSVSGVVDADVSYSQIGNDIGELVAEKQLQYGDSFGKSGAMLKILYPDGVPVESLDDVLVIARILDKIFRIATDNDPTGESPFRDIAGYCLLAIRKNLK